MTREQLIALSWRYAALVGIVRPSSCGLTATSVAVDRQLWPELIRVEGGLPVFDLDQGARFMSVLSGTPIEECRHLIEEEWPEKPAPVSPLLAMQLDPNQAKRKCRLCGGTAYSIGALAIMAARFCDGCGAVESYTVPDRDLPWRKMVEPDIN